MNPDYPPELPDVERYVQILVAGGIALTAGLWLTHLYARYTPRWLFGLALALAGLTGLAQGLWTRLDY